jgi:hypothetical protein
MKRETTIAVVVGVLILTTILTLFATGIISQSAIQTPNGNIECTSYAQCAPLLAQQGYTKDQIDRILTTCDENGCRVMP